MECVGSSGIGTFHLYPGQQILTLNNGYNNCKYHSKPLTLHRKYGVMLEWLKRHAWKACIRQKRIPSSNLGHSAQEILKCNPASRSACGIFNYYS